MKTIVVIPARYESSRFPGKPLALILGKPMIQWVYERAKLAKGIAEVYVATDDHRIYETVKSFGGIPIMTGECNCGTDRIFQASKFLDYDVIINVQGDEPAINPREIEQLVACFEDDAVQMATLKQKIKSDVELDDPNIVKVITDKNGDAIYFSRSIIPYNRDGTQLGNCYFRHVGIYGYRKSFLTKFVHLKPSSLERMECLEQLRAIENGYKIRVEETRYSSIGIDRQEQIAEVERYLMKEQDWDKK